MKFETVICLLSLTQTILATVPVPELTPDNFRNLTTRPDGATLVMFYTPWCPHCQTTKPLFFKAAELMAQVNQSNRFAMMNCDDEKNSVLCTAQNIEGYPTIKLYVLNKNYTFNAESTENNFINFFSDPEHMTESTPNEDETPDTPLKNTPYLNADNFKSTLTKTAHALVFFYAPWCPHCQEAKPALESATEKLTGKDRVIFAVNCEEKINKKLCDDEKVEGFPTVRYYHNGEMFAEYDERMEASGFLEYLSKPPKTKVPLVVPEADKSEDGQGDDIKMKHVQQITNDDFAGLLKNKKQQTMVMFYIPECSHCKEAKPVYDKAAEQIHNTNPNNVLVALNCAEKINEMLCEKEKISGFPSFIHYHNGQRVKEYTEVPITTEKLIKYFSFKVKEEL